MPSVLDLEKGSGCFTEFHFLEFRDVAHTTSPSLSCCSLAIYAMMVEDIEQAPPPARFTLWPLCTDQCSPNSSLVEKESQVDLPFLCCFLPGLEQLYWLSLSLSSGLLFKYSQKYVDSPGLIPAALWRHSWVFVKAGALTVNISLALSAVAPFQLGGQTCNNFFVQSKPEPQSNGFQKWRHKTGA